MNDAKLAHILHVFYNHKQHHAGSCVASSVEIVLKAEKLVELSFRELQDQFPQESTGMNPFFDVAFEARFKVKFRPVSLRREELEGGLYDIIDKELAASRFPLISLFGGNLDPGTGSATGHMHLVVQEIANDYLALSKSGFLTMGQLAVQSATYLKATNLYLYELV